MNKSTETKYYDLAEENLQLYHNVGQSGGALAPTVIYGDPTFFSPWNDIPPGTGRANRVGDKITPLCMTMKIWLANKKDRPNVMYRIIIAKMPKAVGTTLTTSSSTYPFQLSQTGATGNAMVLPVDHDKGIKPYYDRVHNLQLGASFIAYDSAANKECHKFIQLKIKRKRAGNIIFDSTTQHIVNSPLALYVIPYDSYGTLVTDNIASYSYHARLYYKDS